MRRLTKLLIVFLLLFPAMVRSQGWWKKNNLRVIQVNLPAYEAATLNADSLVEDLIHYSANTLLINAGGIMAFYPSKLPFHYINPYMRPEMLGNVIKKCHEHNIKVIVRFDFSRMHESIFKAHPDWCYISPAGERMINTDMYVVSINAPYEQQHAFSIVKEVLDLYPVDGIFLNMPGYQTGNAYEGKYHGIDQNEYDRIAFEKFSGINKLPTKEDPKDPAYEKYVEFKKHSVEDWSKRLHELVHGKSDQIAICTYSDKFVDIIRHESQTNSLPYWPYSASDNVGNSGNSYPNHVISNSSIQQISFRSRYNAIEPGEISIRLYENIANGSGLDISMMGDMRGYEDERNYGAIKKIYAFHQKNEKYFGNYQSAAKVALVAPGIWPSGEPMQEYRGIFMMLKEAHVQFDIIESTQLVALKESMKKYGLIIMPEIMGLEKDAVDVLKELCNSGTRIIATNRSFSDDSTTLLELFGAKVRDNITDAAGYYLSIDNKNIFRRLEKQKMIFWKFNLGLYDFTKADETFLPVLDKGRPGPPEIIGGHDPTGYMAMGIKKYGKGSAALLPENIGRLYFIHGYEEHKNIILDVITHLYPQAFEQLTTNAPARVEIIVKDFGLNEPGRDRKNKDGTIVHFVNLTGFSGNTYFDALPVYGINFSVKLPLKPSKVYLLSDRRPVPFVWKNGAVSGTLKSLHEFESVVMEK